MSVSREPNAEPIAGYRLIEPLGSGGFGEAWKCEAPGGLFKAIKFVYGNLNSLDVDGARAEQELKALNRIKEVRHPFVLSVDRIDIVEGELVIVMELADRNLHDAYEEAVEAGLVGIPRDTLLRYVRDAAEALDHMNEKHNLQHLDVKPRNLFLVSDRVKVADFGLVKHLERSGASGILGGVTPIYAPPETFSGTISGRSDQYSLAIVYQELLTGQRPFNGKNARLLAHQHLHEEPELRVLPEGERTVVARALAKDPTRRFPNCLAFVRALYQARSPNIARAETLLPDDEDVSAEAKRPAPKRAKTMADTMENILLEQMPREDAVGSVDLGADPGSPGDNAHEEVSRLGLTMALPQTGALRPTLVIGLGSLGRRALLELRCRLLDRFGDLDKIPLMRFLYIDTDAEAVKNALRGAPEVALKPGEVYHLPLQPVSHYRRRQLDQLNDWLPREKLYAMPRSLKTQGSRALGRLAFADNYLRLTARLRREIQQACHPDAIYQTVSQTGLALRDNVARVYVLACATGGSSGCLPDLGYTLRRLLQQLHQPGAPVTSLLLCGAPDDPATPPAEQANLYATLTELNHFADPYTQFSAQYGSDGPRLVDEGPVYDQTYLLTQPHRTPECRGDILAHLGSFLFHEVTTPLGLRLDQVRLNRNASQSTHFRSLGTHGVWFPRGLLLRLAGREATRRVLDAWQSPQLGDAGWGLGNGGAPPPGWSPQATNELLQAACARVLADPDLQPEALQTRIAERAGGGPPGSAPGSGDKAASRDTGSYAPTARTDALGIRPTTSGGLLDGSPREVLARLLSRLEEQSQQGVAQEDPGAWARQVLTRVEEWLGGGFGTSGGMPAGIPVGPAQRKSRLTKALEEAASQLAVDWDERLGQAALGLTEHPGRRLALAEAALTRFIQHCNEVATACEVRLQQQAAKSAQAQDLVQAALEGCLACAGGFSWFGGKSRRVLRVFVDHLAAFARQCLAEDMTAAVVHFFHGLRGRLNDRLRDLSFCRQRLRHLVGLLGDGAWETAGDENPHVTPQPHMEDSPSPLLSTESFWDAIRNSGTARVVRPEGATDLEQAARRVLDTLTGEQWLQLDHSFQDNVLAVVGGLQRACLNTSDLIRHLAAPLVNQAVACLSGILPITDVAQVEFSLPAGVGEDLTTRIHTYHDRARPLLQAALEARDAATPEAAVRDSGSGYRSLELTGVSSGSAVAERPPTEGRTPSGPRHLVLDTEETAFLLIPASEAGKRYADEAQKQLPGVHLVNVPGQADLMFCREQHALRLEDLERVLRPCRRAYEEAAGAPPTSPHSRFDLQDWTPLDP